MAQNGDNVIVLGREVVTQHGTSVPPLVDLVKFANVGRKRLSAWRFPRYRLRWPGRSLIGNRWRHTAIYFYRVGCHLGSLA